MGLETMKPKTLVEQAIWEWDAITGLSIRDMNEGWYVYPITKIRKDLKEAMAARAIGKRLQRAHNKK